MDGEREEKKSRRKSLSEMKGERRKENEKKSHSEYKESCICDELKNQHTTLTHTAYILRERLCLSEKKKPYEQSKEIKNPTPATTAAAATTTTKNEKDRRNE